MQYESPNGRLEETPKTREPVSCDTNGEKDPQEDVIARLKTLPGHKLITSTPVFFRKVISPNNLQLDSEPSNVAEWSLSMATPANREAAKGSPLTMLTTGATTTTEEESEGGATTDESVLEFRFALKERVKKASCRKQLRYRGAKSVARALFPVTPLGLSNSTLASPLFSFCQTPTPDSATPRGSPGRGQGDGRGSEREPGGNHSMSYSQELFGSPASDVMADKEPHSPCRSEAGGVCEEESGPVDCVPANSLHMIQETPARSPVREDGGDKSLELCQLSGVALEEVRDLVHSTPVSTAPSLSSQKIGKPLLDFSRDAILQASWTPEVPLVSATEPSPHGQVENTPPAHTADVSGSEFALSGAQTPSRSAAIKTVCSAATTSGVGEDLLDMLFMTSSQLESHISSYPSSPVPQTPPLGTTTEHRSLASVGDVEGEGSCHERALAMVKECCDVISIDEQSKKLSKHFSYPSSKQTRSRVRSKETTTATTMFKDKLDVLSVGVSEKVDVMGVASDQAAKKQCVVECDETDIVQEGSQVDNKRGGDGGVGVGDELVRDNTEEDGDTNDTKSLDGGGVSAMVDKVAFRHSTESSQQSTDVPCEGLEMPCITTHTCEDNASTETMDTVKPPSPVPLTRQRRAPGLSKRAPTSSHQTKPQRHTGVEEAVIVPPPDVALPAEDGRNDRHFEGNAFIGFKTASGSAISISKSALDRAKTLIGEDVEMLNNVEQEQSDVADKDVTPVQSRQKTPITSLNHNSENACTDSTDRNNETMPHLHFPRKTPFRTHPGPHPLGPTTVPRKRSSSRICQLSRSFKTPRLACDVPEAEEKSSLARILKNFGKSGVQTSKNEMDCKPSVIESGFSTANGRKLIVSSSALLKAQKMLMEEKENIVELTNVEEVSSTADGCKTAFGANFVTSSPIRDKPHQNNASPMDLQCIPLYLSPSITLPTTGDGICNSDMPVGNFRMSGFQTAGGKGITVSKNALEKAQQIFDTCTEQVTQSLTEENNLTVSTCLTGFKTASGNALTVSSKSLEKAKQVIRDCEDTKAKEDAPPFLCPHDSCVTGFKTASGSALTVSKKSLEKAKQVLTESENGPSLRGGVMEEKDSTSYMTGFKTAGGSALTVSKKSLEKAKQVLTECENGQSSRGGVIEENDSISCMTGFKTASGSALAVSKKSLEKAKLVMEECESDDGKKAGFEDDNKRDFPFASSGTVGVADDCVSQSTMELAETVRDTNEDSGSCYFSTQVVKQLIDFSSDEEEENHEEISTIVGSELHTTSSTSPIATAGSEGALTASSLQLPSPRPGAGSQSVPQHLQEEQTGGDTDCMYLLSESTIETIEVSALGLGDLELDANGDSVDVNGDTMVQGDMASCADTAMDTAMDTGMDIDLDTTEKGYTASAEATTGMASLSPPASLTNAESVFEEALDTCSEMDGLIPVEQIQFPVDSFSNLPAAVEEKAEIGEESNLAVKPICRDSDESSRTSPEATSGQRVETRDKSLVIGGVQHSSAPFPSPPMASGMKGETEVESMKPTLGDNVIGEYQRAFCGFRTASGKKVEISDESIRAAKMALGDSEVLVDAQLSSCLQVAEMESRDEFITAAEIAGESTETEESSIVIQPALFPGLQTASGKQVEIRDESIRAAKMALGDNVIPSTMPTSFPGLQTARVKIADESIRAAKMALGDDMTTSFPGLQTASGKQVEIRDESIRAAKMALGDNMIPSTRPTSFPGLQTASGKIVEIADESIRAAKMTLGDNVIPSTRPTSFPGLQTASGKRVKVADESIKAARLTLGDGANPQLSSSSFQGLQTASGRQVNIKPSSMRAAREALRSDTTATSCNLNQTSRPFRVLHTESGQQLLRTCSKPVTALPSKVRMFAGQENTLSQQRVPRQSNRTTPEGILCDRTPSGKGQFLPLYSSVNMSAPHPSAISHMPAPHPSTVSQPMEITRNCRNNSFHVFGRAAHAHQTTPSNPAPPSASNHQVQHHYHHHTRSQLTPSKGYLPSHHTLSHNHTHSQTPTGSRAYSSVSKTNFSTPVKGHPKSKYSWMNGTQGSLLTHHSTPKPIWRRDDSTRTRAQAGGGVVSEVWLPEVDCPLHVTLSQVCMMEQSQSRAEECTDSSLGETSKTWKVTDDSGYASREVSSLKSPSPLEPEPNCTPLKREWDRGPLEHQTQQQGDCQEGICDLTDDITDLLFAEVAMETLEDTLGSDSMDSNHASADISLDPLTSASQEHLGDTVVEVTNDFDHTVISTGCDGEGGGKLDKTGCDGEGEGNGKLDKTDHGVDASETVRATGPAEMISCSHTNMDGECFEEEIQDCRNSIASGPAKGREGTIQCHESGVHTIADASKTVEGLLDISQHHHDACADLLTIMNATATSSERVTCDRLMDKTQDLEQPMPTTIEPQLESLGPMPTTPTAIKPQRGSQEPTPTTIEPQLESLGPMPTTIKPQVGSQGLEEPILVSPSSRLESQKPMLASPTIIKAQLRFQEPMLTTIKPQPGSQKPMLASPTTIKPQLGSLLSARLEHTSERVSLPDIVGCPAGRRDPAELSRLGVPSCVQAVRGHNAGSFRFSSEFFSSFSLSDGSVCVGDGAVVSLKEGTVGVTELWEAFVTSPGVDVRLISYRWFDNHFRRLVTKLASMEVCYPEVFSGRCLTPDWLMLQMKYRYDREIDRAERSTIHKICEHDDIPSRRMVLYVSKCCPPLNNDLAKMESTGGMSQEQKADLATVELSDGWYSLPCELDPPLSHMIKRGTIAVGTKLMISGAELVGVTSPCHPLDVPDTCRLRIFTNSTRRARWFARLGYQSCPQPFPVPLESLFAEGGRVGCVDAVIARVYPLVYLERSSKKMRCERAEQREVSRHRREREKAVDRISSKVQRDFENEVALQDCPPVAKRRRSRRLNALQVKQLQDGETIYSTLLNTADPQAFQEMLSSTQLVYLESYQLSLISRRQSELQERIKSAIEDAADVIPDRDVSPLLKIRLVPLGEGASEGRGNSSYQLSIWRPNANLMQILKEGAVVRFMNVAASQTKHKYDSFQLELTANRSTQFIPRCPEGLDLACYQPRGCVGISTIGSGSALPLRGVALYKEFDTVGVVVHVYTTHVVSHDLGDQEQVIDVVCLADACHGILMVKAWGGLKCYGLEDVVSVGTSLALSNLSYRGTGPGYPWPTATLGNHVVVSQNPKEKHLAAAFVTLQKQLSVNRTDYLKEVRDTVRTYL